MLMNRLVIITYQNYLSFLTREDYEEYNTRALFFRKEVTLRAGLTLGSRLLNKIRTASGSDFVSNRSRLAGFALNLLPNCRCGIFAR